MWLFVMFGFTVPNVRAIFGRPEKEQNRNNKRTKITDNQVTLFHGSPSELNTLQWLEGGENVPL